MVGRVWPQRITRALGRDGAWQEWRDSNPRPSVLRTVLLTFCGRQQPPVAIIVHTCSRPVSLSIPSSRDGRKARPILTLQRIGRALQNSSQVATNEPVQHSTIDPAAQFAARLWRERITWSIDRRGGMFGGRALNKADADALLRRELAAVGGGA